MITLVGSWCAESRERSPGHGSATPCGCAHPNPKTGRVGGQGLVWALLFTVLSGVVNALGIDPVGPAAERPPEAIGTDRVVHYFSGNWVGYALVVAVAFLAPVAEELVFRGLLLPRMRKAFGRGTGRQRHFFTLYHLHQPWSMPATLIDGILNQAYPTRIPSTWMGSSPTQPQASSSSSQSWPW